MASTVNYSNRANFFNRNRPVQRQRRSQPYEKTRQTQSKKTEKGWIKDVILLPSPNVKTFLRNLLRETLFDEGFVISGFKLKSSASEKKLTIKNRSRKCFQKKWLLFLEAQSSTLSALWRRRLSKFVPQRSSLGNCCSIFADQETDQYS